MCGLRFLTGKRANGQMRFLLLRFFCCDFTYFQVQFTDEAHFEVQGQRSQFVRRSKGEPLRPGHINQRPKHPDKVMFWGMFGFDGPGPLEQVTGMMNSDQYIGVLQRNVIPEHMRTAFTFQQDLAPCHTSKKVQQFMKTKKLKVLKWPGNSPDLNPIENLWAIIKKRLRKLDCSTKPKLISAVFQVWNADAELRNMCKKLVESMPNRVQEVIKCRGGHTKY